MLYHGNVDTFQFSSSCGQRRLCSAQLRSTRPIYAQPRLISPEIIKFWREGLKGLSEPGILNMLPLYHAGKCGDYNPGGCFRLLSSPFLLPIFSPIFWLISPISLPVRRFLPSHENRICKSWTNQGEVMKEPYIILMILIYYRKLIQTVNTHS